MLRHKKIVLVVAVISAAATLGLFWRYSDRGPTSEEFRVYDAFLSRLAVDGHLQTGNGTSLQQRDRPVEPQPVRLERLIGWWAATREFLHGTRSEL